MIKDYQEIICEAVDIIVQQRLSEIKFDETIKCKVVEVVNKEKGEYAVLYNDTLRFIAYSEEGKNYREGNWVYVLVPKGDYTQDKIIQGRYSSSEKEEPVAFISPLENIAKIQDIFLYNGKTLGLVANDKKGKTEIDFFDSEEVKQNNGFIYQNIDLSQIKYVCFSAEFRTLLDAYDVRQGNYGLSLAISSNKGIYKYDLSAESEMFGNPYAYRGFQKQEQVYSISFEEDEVISGFGLIFYQNNDFKYYDGINFEFQRIQPSELNIKDIEVKNINIYFGKDLKKENSENFFEILTQDTIDIDPNKTYVIDGTFAQLLLDAINRNKE